jgi:hypothetical protein
MDWEPWCWGFGWADLMGDFRCHRRRGLGVGTGERGRHGVHRISEGAQPYGSDWDDVMEADVRNRACRILWRLNFGERVSSGIWRFWALFVKLKDMFAFGSPLSTIFEQLN